MSEERTLGVRVASSALLGASAPANRDTETLRKILCICNAGRRVSFEADWGENTLTVFVGDAHSHVGSPGGSEEQLMQSLNALLCNDRGLSWAVPPNARVKPPRSEAERSA